MVVLGGWAFSYGRGTPVFTFIRGNIQVNKRYVGALSEGCKPAEAWGRVQVRT